MSMTDNIIRLQERTSKVGTRVKWCRHFTLRNLMHWLFCLSALYFVTKNRNVMGLAVINAIITISKEFISCLIITF